MLALLAIFAARLRQGALKGGDTHARNSTEVHGHPALPSLRNGGDTLKIFALEQCSLLEPVDGKAWAHANQLDVWAAFTAPNVYRICMCSHFTIYHIIVPENTSQEIKSVCFWTFIITVTRKKLHAKHFHKVVIFVPNLQATVFVSRRYSNIICLSRKLRQNTINFHRSCHLLKYCNISRTSVVSWAEFKTQWLIPSSHSWR